MTPEQIAIIQGSWAKVRPIADTAMELFYQRLFAVDADLARLFTHTDMARQHHQLAAAIELAVSRLDDFENLRPALGELGQRHRGYGVPDRAYDSVGAALLWTLEQGLGDDWNDDAAAAWAAAYGAISAAMRAQVPLAA